MKENKIRVIGITKQMELHIHGNTKDIIKEWYANLSITEIIDILEQYTYEIGDEKEREMLQHLGAYFYDKITI